MSPDMTKPQRRQMRNLAGLAHDRELSRELALLEAEFARWRAGELDPHELNDRIHKFHQGPSRRLFVFFTESDPTYAVASAIAEDVLKEEEVGAELMEILGKHVEWARSRLAAEAEEAEGDAKRAAEGAGQAAS